MHPYQSLPPHAFWKTGVADNNAFDMPKIWRPEFPILADDKIATYGSCFAQHFGKALAEKGVCWLRTEPAVFGMSKPSLTAYSYDLFSCRTGNIYTTSQLLQWSEWAMEPSKMPDELWEKNGRYYDPLRPTLEPDGFASEKEVATAREVTREAFRQSIIQAQVVVFTLGLTERWQNKRLGFEYGICPPPAHFDAKNHVFSNMTFREVEAALLQAIANFRQLNPTLKILLTVSPVPLVATATGGHVLAATTHSKAILRAVAGQVALDHKFVDYFPSYEIINNPVTRGVFFEHNMRSINKAGVAHVMDIFFAAQRKRFGENNSQAVGLPYDDTVVCEEEMLSAFGGNT